MNIGRFNHKSICCAWDYGTQLQEERKTAIRKRDYCSPKAPLGVAYSALLVALCVRPIVLALQTRA
jgi:hypothetical protein